jgi:transcriptional regulator with XRE-family HTH domain
MARNKLLEAPPYPVEEALKQLGEKLRTARVRRSLTIDAVAKKIGVGVRAIHDAERGKPSSSIAIYTALLWIYDLLNDFKMLADPIHDSEGQALVISKEGLRVRRKKGLNNDF